MPKIMLETIEPTNATFYPPPFGKEVAGRHYRRLAPVLGLADFGASEVTLDPGGWSSQRHWHEGEDELVIMTEGEAVLVESDAETVLRPGDVAGFPKGVANGHHLINRSDKPCRFVAIGRPAASDCHYPDIDMHLDRAMGQFTHKDGTPY